MSVNDQICLVTMWCGNYLGSDNWKDSQNSNKVHSWKIYDKLRTVPELENAHRNTRKTWNARVQLPKTSLRYPEFNVLQAHDRPWWSVSRNTRSRPLGSSVIIAPWADSQHQTECDQVRQAWTIILNVFHYKQCRRASSRCLQRGFQDLNRTL